MMDTEEEIAAERALQKEQLYLRQVSKEMSKGRLPKNHLVFEYCREDRNRLRKECKAKEAEIKRLETTIENMEYDLQYGEDA